LGKQETDRNRALAAAGKGSEMKFAVYQDPEVRAALMRLFLGKCAYCECIIETQQPGDIEHYRPKGALWTMSPAAGGRQRRLKRLGYYWLAADWSNLLLSCADCNRPRRHVIEIGVARRLSGKGCWFPLLDEGRRATADNDVANEPRLLLDPCVDDPEEHLSYTFDGAIEPRLGPEGASEMAQETIRLCALDRLPLVQARARLKKRISHIAFHIERQIDADEPVYPEDLDALDDLIETSAEFSGYAKFLVVNLVEPLLARASRAQSRGRRR
jgi:uncharacterized protein (TIGR02646 family)